MMNIRLFSATAVAAIGLTCAQGASAATTVSVAYVAPAVVYAPPRPVYYYGPRYYVPARTVVVAPAVAPVAVLPPPPPPIPVYAPPVRVTYAQRVVVAPVVVMH
ncbi:MULTISPECIES: hypothetical protein [unclassified Caballeronia]|uniref:hypothetical protein n=1 Tax=unclassified Caballeronia TaxID=2646786 RepID=UPI00285D8C8D|nr:MULTISPECIES: hypothetical protein [unclassified Caballeronia]MDR5739583.1 hypothetical protein [Caballeronia sp. LZ016]MDR5808050.1 hypothetical protein [Caballeronia sp. LZ019]